MVVALVEAGSDEKALSILLNLRSLYNWRRLSVLLAVRGLGVQT